MRNWLGDSGSPVLSHIPKTIWRKKQTENVSHVQKYSFHTKSCHTAWLPRSCRRGEGRDMTEVYKIMTSTEKELTKEANSCSISILLQEGGTAITKRQVLEKQKEVLLPRICNSSGTVIIYTGRKSHNNL